MKPHDYDGDPFTSHDEKSLGLKRLECVVYNQLQLVN